MLRFVTSALAALAIVAGVSFASSSFAAPAFTPAQKAELNAAIKQFIMDNPQVLISSVEAHYNKQQAQKQEQEGPIKEFPAGLLDHAGTPFAGPKDAKVVMVEFFDYNCGYCKQVATDLQRVIDEDKNVKVIFKDLPILSDTSETAARYALAANKQGKYLPYHMALLQHQGPITEDFLTATAKSVGLNVEKMKTDANSQDIRDTLQQNVELARELGIRGTPFFVIGREKVPGAIGYSRMKEMIDAQSGVKPAAAAAAPVAAPVAAKPAVKAEAAPAAQADEDLVDPKTRAAIESAAPSAEKSDAVQSEVEKARAEASAMIQEIRAEAAKMQADALESQKKAEAAMAAETAKEKAAPAKK